MTAPENKEVLILAGPNGAGKTTFAREFLLNEARCPTFVNADLIAAGLSPFRPELAAMRAGRIMVDLIRTHVARGESFAVETTLADRSYARMIRDWRAASYRVSIWFLPLPSAEVAVARVAERVSHGGHAVPDSVVRRRFAAGLENFENLYKPRRGRLGSVRQRWRRATSARLGRATMNPKPIEQARNPLLAAALPALRRARQRAEAIAIANNTALVTVVDGEIVRAHPKSSANGGREQGSK